MEYGYLMHYGIKGMRWGFRKSKKYKNLISNAKNYIGNKTNHYTRNENNLYLPSNDADAARQGWIKLSSKESAMHQFNKENGVENSKWVSPDGHREVVFTGKGNDQHVTTDARDIGTYNYYDPRKNPAGHVALDVIPYVILGNSSEDSTTIYQRISESAKNFVKDTKVSQVLNKVKDKKL